MYASNVALKMISVFLSLHVTADFCDFHYNNTTFILAALKSFLLELLITLLQDEYWPHFDRYSFHQFSFLSLPQPCFQSSCYHGFQHCFRALKEQELIVLSTKQSMKTRSLLYGAGCLALREKETDVCAK